MTHEIDWTNAPEGATHYAAAEGIFYACFYKDDFKQVWVCDGESEQWSPNRPSFAKSRVLIPCPASTAILVDVPTIVGIDWAENMTAPVEPEPVAKSDFAVALEAERQRVYDAVAIGGTVERLAELTGLHVDDVQQHLDALIVDGAIYQKPIVIAMSYGVMG